MKHRAPALLLCFIVGLTCAGVTFEIGGAVLNYGPLYAVGGVCIGFAWGFYLSRQTMLRALEQVHRTTDRRQ